MNNYTLVIFMNNMFVFVQLQNCRQPGKATAKRPSTANWGTLVCKFSFSCQKASVITCQRAAWSWSGVIMTGFPVMAFCLTLCDMWLHSHCDPGVVEGNPCPPESTAQERGRQHHPQVCAHTSPSVESSSLADFSFLVSSICNKNGAEFKGS